MNAAPTPAYTLVRSQRRTIGLEINREGLLVRAPLRASAAQIDAVLAEKSAWIHSKLRLVQERQSRQIQLDWQAATPCLPYLGGQLSIHLHPTAPAQGEAVATGTQQWALHLACPPAAPPAVVRAQVWAWWVREAVRLYRARLTHFAPQLQVRWQHLRLAAARTRWGSASSDGRIMLNTALLHYRQPVIDYVVVHELAHLHEMNHSPRFWAWVAQACPDYLALRAELRSQSMPKW